MAKTAQLQSKINNLEIVVRLQSATAISELLTRKFEEANRARLYPQRIQRVWGDRDLSVCDCLSDLEFHQFLRCRRDTQDFCQEIDRLDLSFAELAELAAALLKGCR